VRQHGWERTTWLAPRFVRATLRSFERRDARCVGPTSAFSRSSYEYSCLVGSRLRHDVLAHILPTWGYRLLHGRAIRFGGLLVRAEGRSCSQRRRVSRTSDIPVATLVVGLPLARTHAPAESRQDRFSLDRVSDANRVAIRDAFRRSRTFAPQHPFECPAQDFFKLTAWPPQTCFSSPLFANTNLLRGHER
jgi:hypothetical protein